MTAIGADRKTAYGSERSWEAECQDGSLRPRVGHCVDRVDLL